MRKGIPVSTRLPAILVAALLMLGAAVGFAQDLTPEALRQAAERTGLSEEELLRRYRAEAGVEAEEPAAEPGRTALPEFDAPVVVLPLSDVLEEPEAEEADSLDAESGLSDEFFGAEFFRGDPSLFAPAAFGPVPGDYLLGPGDEVVVDVWGDVEFRHERLVDRDGTITLPKGGRTTCAGRTLDQVARDVRDKLSRSYSGIASSGDDGDTYVAVSLGRLRAIRVFVVGEVSRPGAYDLNGMATVFTALHAAGGPGELGSLRDVRLMRGKARTASLDLYDYLLSGSRAGDAALRDGDTVFIPPRESAVTIEGEVRRPRIYEMKQGEGVRDLIRFAGGFTAEAETRLVHVERILPPAMRRTDEPDRVQRDLDLRQKMIHLLHDGDLVTVAAIAERLENWVEIEGNVKRPGRYEYREGLSVTELVKQAGGLWDDTLLERAILERTDPDGTWREEEVPLGRVMAGESADLPLRPMDALHVYSAWDLRDRYEVHVTGEVRVPGSFAWREGMTLRDVILKAGGLKDSADLLHAEISRISQEAIASRDLSAPPANTVDVVRVELGDDWLVDGGRFELRAHDRVAIRGLPWWQLQRTVAVRGEVNYEGTYSLERPDERLSDVIARAGGLKPTAYADGARIVRPKDDIGNVALDLGRALEKPGCEHDALLESGDTILVPPVPYTVKVAGAVGFPTSIIWENGKSLGDYVSRAGGYADQADKWKTHVVYPNGMSRQIRRVWGDPEVKPGSTIVVPMKTPDEGPGKLETMKEIASILASVATVWLVIDRTN